MRKLIVSMNLTLDGFMAGPDDELDWHFDNWSADMAQTLTEDLEKVDTIILGRITYEAMAAYWPYKSSCLSFPREDIAFADKMNNYTKLVFSKTINRPCWKNSRILKGNISTEIFKLKESEGKDMIVYGSGKLVTSLMRLNLIDEYLTWIHPVLIGDGRSFFDKLNGKLDLQFIERKKFASGVVALRYKVTS